MAKNKKPKFLEKETPDLLALLKETLAADDEADIKKALKIVDELTSRQPTEEGPLSVDEALQAAASVMTDALNKVKAAYDNEVAMLEDSDGDEAEAESDEDEEDEAPKKSKKDKKSKKGGKKSKKDEEEEEEDDEDSDDSDDDEGDDDDGEDYSDWATKDLKAECRKRGIKVKKGMGKAEMVKALEADDQE